MLKLKIALTYTLATLALYSASVVPASDSHLIASAELTSAMSSYTRATECAYKLTPKNVDTINQAIEYTGFIKLCEKN